jgi:hypothetical protein
MTAAGIAVNFVTVRMGFIAAMVHSGAGFTTPWPIPLRAGVPRHGSDVAAREGRGATKLTY